jgi:symplekin
MATAESSAMEKMIQARNAALENVSLYPQVMEPVLGLASNSPTLELQRWAADFMAEGLASPSLASEEKEKMALFLLRFLKSFLELPSEDVGILKSTIQACASAYPLVFRYM